jgi:hypothetical protein
VAMVLWAFGAFGLLMWFLWRSQQYVAARTGADRMGSLASGSRMSSRPFGPAIRLIIRRQSDPAMESARRWLWLSFAVWVLYALLGNAFWRILIGWLSP